MQKKHTSRKQLFTVHPPRQRGSSFNSRSRNDLCAVVLAGRPDETRELALHRQVLFSFSYIARDC